MVARGRRLVGRLGLGHRQLGLDPRRSFALHDQRRLQRRNIVARRARHSRQRASRYFDCADVMTLMDEGNTRDRACCDIAHRVHLSYDRVLAIYNQHRDTLEVQAELASCGASIGCCQ